MYSHNSFQSIPLVKAVISYHVSGTSKISVELLVRLPKKTESESSILMTSVYKYWKERSKVKTILVLSKHTKSYFSPPDTLFTVFTKRTQQAVQKTSPILSSVLQAAITHRTVKISGETWSPVTCLYSAKHTIPSILARKTCCCWSQQKEILKSAPCEKSSK